MHAIIDIHRPDRRRSSRPSDSAAAPRTSVQPRQPGEGARSTAFEQKLEKLRAVPPELRDAGEAR